MTARAYFLILAPLLALAAPAASHPETRSFLVTGDAESVLVIRVPWAVMAEPWRNSAAIWTEDGTVELTYEAECEPDASWRFEPEQPGAALPGWLHRGDGTGSQRQHIDAYLCGGGDARDAPMIRRMGGGEDDAARFRALVAAGVTPGAARAIAVSGARDPGLIDALGESDISAGSVAAVRERARAIVEIR